MSIIYASATVKSSNSLTIGITFAPSRKLLCLSLEDLLQLGSNSITDLGGAVGATDIAGADTGLDDVADSGLDGLGLLWQVKGVQAHHGCGQDRADWVDDALAGDIWCRAVDWLVDTVAAGSVWDAGEGCGWEETDGAWDDRGLIRDDVAEEVGGDDNAIECAWVLDHNHGCGIDEVVDKLDLWELLLEKLGHDLAP